jgi:hypothetical protein
MSFDISHLSFPGSRLVMFRVTSWIAFGVDEERSTWGARKSDERTQTRIQK